MATEVVFVGTGDAFGSGGRRNSAIVVRSGGNTLLLDCGPSTLTGLKTLGISPLEIDAVAVSHFHGDHAGGLPFLLLDYRYQHPRSAPLAILGPPGVAERVRHMNDAFQYSPHEDRTYDLVFREFEVGKALEAHGFRITPHPALHHPETKPHMLGVTTGSRRVFFTGDTGWHESLPDAVGAADLLISECVFVEEQFEYHMSVERFRAELPRFRCKEIILTHLGSEVLDNDGRVPFRLAEDGARLRL